MGGEESAPAHTHGGKHGYGIVVDDTFSCKLWDKAQCCTYSSQSGDGEGYKLGGIKAKELFEDEIQFAGNQG